MSNSQKNLYKKFLGLKGEKLAVNLLKKQGYTVLLTNYVTPFGEADIVCKKNDTLVFVEVKTRSNLNYGTPAQAVNGKKQKKYKDIANYYLLTNDCEELNVSFTVVEVLDDEINIITDAF